MVTIAQVESPEQIQQAQELFTEYFAWLKTDVDTDVEDFDDVPSLAGYKEEIAGLPGKFAPPDGRLLLAQHEGKAAGCVAFYKFNDGVCEVKRMWLRPEFRGKKIGRLLMETLIEDARKLGYQSMILNTVDILTAAISLYESLGFVKTEPYYAPGELVLDYELFYKLDLSRKGE